MLESKFKSEQRKELEAKGWKFIQFGNDAPTGFPDTLCLSPSGYSCFVEWKKSKNAKRQPLQEWWIAKLREMGHEAFIVYPENVNEWREEICQN